MGPGFESLRGHKIKHLQNFVSAFFFFIRLVYGVFRMDLSVVFYAQSFVFFTLKVRCLMKRNWQTAAKIVAKSLPIKLGMPNLVICLSVGNIFVITFY